MTRPTPPHPTSARTHCGDSRRSLRRSWATVGAATLCNAVIVTGAVADAPMPRLPDMAAADGYMSSHLLVRVTPGTSIEFGPRGPSVRDAQGRRQPAAERSLANAQVRAIAPALSTSPARADIAARVGLDRYRRVLLAPGTDPLVARDFLRAAGGVLEHVELDSLGGVVGGEPVIPTDADFPIQWSLLNIGQVVAGNAGVFGADVSAPEGWAYTTGEALLVAVLDSGVNVHDELAGRVVAGLNVPQPGGPTTDGCASHGTHVSGILGARGDNDLGIAGMSWFVEIMPVVVVNPCSGPESMVADGLVWATDAGARIANMSLQYNAGSALLKAAVEYAHALDVVMIAATGNSNAAVSFPARWPETIAVGATNNLDQRWASSNFGPEIDLSAPGVSIWSLSGTSGYAYQTGTSMAAPHVSGAVALMLSINPSLTNEQVRLLLRSTADDIGPAGFDVVTGHGRLNTAALLAATMETLAPSADLNGDGTVDAADLGLLLNAWGPCGGSPCVGDLDDDDAVGGTDLGLLLNAWGSGPPS